jgi:hypothetical protein
MTLSKKTVGTNQSTTYIAVDSLQRLRVELEFFYFSVIFEANDIHEFLQEIEPTLALSSEYILLPLWRDIAKRYKNSKVSVKYKLTPMGIVSRVVNWIGQTNFNRLGLEEYCKRLEVNYERF